MLSFGFYLLLSVKCHPDPLCAPLPSLLSPGLPVPLSVCLSVYLSACLPVPLPVSLSVYLSASLPVPLSVCLSTCLPIYLSPCLSVSLPVCLSTCPMSVCLFVCLSCNFINYYSFVAEQRPSFMLFVVVVVLVVVVIFFFFALKLCIDILYSFGVCLKYIYTNRISPSWARGGCKKTLCLLHYPRKKELFYSFSLYVCQSPWRPACLSVFPSA